MITRTSQTKPKVFLSHVTEEAALAHLIKAQLEHDYLGMVEVFVSSDRASISLGGRWLDDISDGLDEAKIMLILCSEESTRRPWVFFEAGAGWVKKIPVVPICHSGIMPSRLPIPLNMLQGFVANNVAGWTQLYALLADQLGSHIPQPDLTDVVRRVITVEQGLSQKTASARRGVSMKGSGTKRTTSSRPSRKQKNGGRGKG